VASLSLFVNSVLTASYNAIYGTEEDDTELILVVAPLSANTEVQALYAAGLIDYETALPAALHSLGCSAEEIASAMERRRKIEIDQKAMQSLRDSTEQEELAARSQAVKREQAGQTEKVSGSGSAESATDDSRHSNPASASGTD